ncbi:MAG TPA: hypothetical protein VF228_11020 [Iamia sp.]
MTAAVALPEVDVHSTTVAGPPDVVWPALLATVDRAFAGPGAVYARLVGCDPPAASGPRPLEEGSAIPGFAVTRAQPGRELALEGRHLFSRYALTFRLEPRGAAETVLSADSRAAFPGVHGRAYRLLVVGTGGHVVAVRRLLRSIRRRAEAG